MRVLIVEDEALLAMMLEDMVRDAGHHVVGVASEAPTRKAWSGPAYTDKANRARMQTIDPVAGLSKPYDERLLTETLARVTAG